MISRKKNLVKKTKQKKNIQRDLLTMGGCVFPVFCRYWLLSYSYFYWAELIHFHIKFSTFVGKCLKRELHFLIKNLCENESTLIYMPHKSSRKAAAKSKQI